MLNDSADSTKKIAVVGSTECGKTSLIRAFIEVIDSQESARNFRDVAVSNIDIDETNYSVIICEAPCLQSYRGERAEIYEDVDAIIMCFSVDDMNSLLCVSGIWLREIKENRPDVPLVLVANKCDLRFEDAASNLISYNNGLLTANNLSAFKYIECSANTKEGILEVFIAAVKSTLN